MKKHHTPKNNLILNEELLSSSLERYRPYLSETEFNALLNEISKPLSIAIRANCLKTEPDTIIQQWLKWYGWEIKDIPYYPYGWQIKNADRSISQTIEHRLGSYYIQDAASMLPVSMFDFSNSHDKLILDMAASPGGKTTQIIDLTKDNNFVIANDSSSSRIQALRVVLENWGASNIMATNIAGEKFGDWFPEAFDYILLDAPCSMENLRPTASHSIRPTTENERSRLSMRQMNLLLSAYKALKPNGQLIYATCSLAPEEDEFVLEALLNEHTTTCGIQKVTKLDLNAPGLEKFGNKIFHESIQNSFRLWPHILSTSGFFAAKISKSDSSITKQETLPDRPLSSSGLTKLKSEDLQKLLTWVEINYGFSLDNVLQELELELFTKKDTFYLIPVKYLDQFNGFPFSMLGMKLGKYSGDNFMLSHEFISRFGSTFENGIMTIDDEYLDHWMQGRDIRSLSDKTQQMGTMVVVKDSRSRILGGGKILSDRIRNLLPQRYVR